MTKAKIAISIDRRILARVDKLVKMGRYASRSAAFESMASEDAERAAEAQFHAQLALIDPAEEKAMAEERYKGDLW